MSMDSAAREGHEEHILTPSELVNSVIKTNIFGGYSKNQVDILLERAADVLEFLQQENAELKRKTEQLEQTVEKYRDIESSLRGALVSSRRWGHGGFRQTPPTPCWRKPALPVPAPCSAWKNCRTRCAWKSSVCRTRGNGSGMILPRCSSPMRPWLSVFPALKTPPTSSSDKNWREAVLMKTSTKKTMK